MTWLCPGIIGMIWVCRASIRMHRWPEILTPLRILYIALQTQQNFLALGYYPPALIETKFPLAISRCAHTRSRVTSTPAYSRFLLRNDNESDTMSIQQGGESTNGGYFGVRYCGVASWPLLFQFSNTCCCKYRLISVEKSVVHIRPNEFIVFPGVGIAGIMKKGFQVFIVIKLKCSCWSVRIRDVRILLNITLCSVPRFL